MIDEVKTKFYELLISLGYNVGDNGVYREEFPYLMIRIGNYQTAVSYDIRFEEITIILDIFSTYNGEKEIIDINKDIINHIEEMRDLIPSITTIYQQGMMIIGDKETGPVRKHGILTYKFTLTSGLMEDDDNETESPTGN